MKMLTILAVTGITLECGLAQEPFTYKPDDIPKHEIPEGLTAEEYIQKIYQERHYKIKITFRAVDEDGNPIPGADADVGIDSLLHADGHNNYKGKTDAKGLFTVESRGQGSSDVVIEKDGYYPSRPKVRWSGKLNNDRELAKKVGFRPWNPTIDVVLRKVGKPIPMRVWRGNTDGAHRAPDIGQEFGFDLFEKDWVKPHGMGKKADLFVKFESEFKDQNDYKTSCSIRFANPDDGLVPVPELVSEESLLKYPREAPLDGYAVKELTIEKSRPSVRGARIFAEQKEPIGYLVRFRSVKNKQTGKIVSAHYGKITRPEERIANVNPFQIGTFVRDADRKLVLAPRFRFSFYLNPNLNDRNLEYDQETNLAPGAPQGVTWLP